MTNRNEFRLCGGVFFSLLLHASVDLETQKNYIPKNSNKGQISVLMSELLCVMNGGEIKRSATERETFKTMASRYRFCKIDHGAQLKIGRGDALTLAFDSDVRNNYSKPYALMKNYVELFVQPNETVRSSLVKALMELIDIDQELSNQSLFISGPTPVAAEGVRNLKTIDLAAFLLGIWHYCTVTVDNKVGEATVDMICPQSNGAPRLYKGDLGESISREIVFEEYSFGQNKEEDVSDNESVEAEQGENNAESEEPLHGFVERGVSDLRQMIINPHTNIHYGSGDIYEGNENVTVIKNYGGKDGH